VILYIGNKLSSHGLTPTAMEVLVPKLKNFFKIKSVSNKKNQFFRFMDMNFIFFKNINSLSLIIVDVFSSRAFYFAVFFSFLSRLFMIPYVPIIRGGNLINRIKRSPSLSKFLFLHSAINVSPSIFFCKFLSKQSYEIIYIPNFVDLDNYPFKKKILLSPKLLWVRSLHKIYNPEMAIHVLHELCKINKSSMLTMIGPDKDGSARNCKNLAIELGVEKQVQFLGKLTKKEWVSISHDSNIFINTTHIDNMPISIIEAMALGFPIVSTNVGGIPFLLKNGNNAILVHDNDLNGMVEGIKLIINNPKIANRLSKSAYRTAQQYSISAVMPKWINLIKQYSKQ